MALDIMEVEYYDITVEDQITNASKLLSTIAGAGVDFHAFKAIPVNCLIRHDSLSLRKIAQR